MGIPKKIIFSAPDKNNLHPKIKKNLDNLSAKNQDWEILVFDDNDIANFIKENFDNFYLDLFKIVNPKLGPAKADLFRYLYILKNGLVFVPHYHLFLLSDLISDSSFREEMICE